MDTQKWGKTKANARYGGQPSASMKSGTSSGKTVNVGLIDQPMLEETGREMQAPQSVNDQHESKYDNDTSGWVRGAPSAEAKPGFDKHKAGR